MKKINKKSLKDEIIELVVNEGRYVNFPTEKARKNKYGGIDASTLLDIVDAKGSLDFTYTRKGSQVARKKALKKAMMYKKKGWKTVTLYPHYSYPNFKYPYRYDIESWGGFE